MSFGKQLIGLSFFLSRFSFTYIQDDSQDSKGMAMGGGGGWGEDG